MRRVRRPRNAEEVRAVATSGAPDAIPTLLRHLGRSDPLVRYTAFEALVDCGEPGFEAAMDTLLRGNMKQRETVAAYLGDWGDDRAVLPLLAAIERAEKERGIPLLAGCIGFMLFGIPAMIGYVLIKTGVLPIFQDGKKVVINAVWSLGKLGDVRAVGKLAQLTRTARQADLASTSRSALMQLLPKVREMAPEQASQLGSNAVVEMAQLLHFRADSETVALNFSLLDALTAVGDGRAIPAVQRLIPSLPPSELRRQAEETLTILLERAAREEARLTLLRGSDAGASPDELLRPVYGETASESAPEQLLRAAPSPSEVEY